MFVLILLSLAQFILTLDTTFMNVSISTLVVDLHTTVTGIQAAIAFYTLVMAAFFPTGAKIGDLIGRKKSFVIGLIVYAIGSFITSISQNIYMLTFGWSLIEGLGAAMIIPAMLSLVRSNFPEGPQRIRAYGILAAVAASGAAVGPIIGGFLTTYMSWRIGFLSEVFIAGFILLNRKKILDVVKPAVNKQFDYIGLFLSALGLATIVTGFLLASYYGIITARKDFSIGGQVIIPQGSISPTIWFALIGLGIVALFVWWQLHRIKIKKSVLLNPMLFKSKIITPGVITTFSIQFVLVGSIFAISLVSQIMLEYNAFQSGLVLLPMSFGVLILGLLAGKMAKRFSSKRLIQLGDLIMLIGTVWLAFSIHKNPSGKDFIPGLFFIGSGVGIAISQLNNLIQSSVPVEQSNETSGINSTFQYLGSSLGTAISGSLIISVFILSSTNLVNQSSVFSGSQKQQINNTIDAKAQTISNSQLDAYISSAPQNAQDELLTINYTAQQNAISITVFVLAVLGAIGLISSSLLPSEKKKKTK
jgi:MFS family permease